MSSPGPAEFAPWSLPVPLTLALILAAFVYARGWFHLRKAYPDAISIWGPGVFMGDLFSLWIAVGLPLTAFDDDLLTIRMVRTFCCWPLPLH